MAKNPLFDVLGGGSSMFPPGMQNILKQFQMFRQSFQGDPKQQVQQMLNSGRITQEQYNRAVQMANELQKMLGQ